VDLVVLDQGIDTSTALGRMFFHILGAIAEFDHALMSERTRDGLAAARARGRTGGQKPNSAPARSLWPGRCTTNATATAGPGWFIR
jgi:DNA invertase Pin-like site-specific DNA recombinase